MKIKPLSTAPTLPLRPALHLLCASALLLGLWGMGRAHAEGSHVTEKKELIEVPLIKQRKAEMAAAAAAAETAPEPAPARPAQEAVKQLRQALSVIGTPVKNAAGEGADRPAVRSVPRPRPVITEVADSRQYIKARAIALAHGTPMEPGDAHAEAGHAADVHWSYDGDNGPQNWAKLKPEFALCGTGKRQSPIAIQSETSLQGPAEPLLFNYLPSRGSVVNNGHTLQVDVEGDNALTVRSATYKLLQFHFHTPSEEMINAKRSAMVAHLVHKNDAGQLAVVAVLMETGEPNTFIDKVWTYMPLDSHDRVRMPEGLLDLNELLPRDQRYYQFMGSLTTPPCSEGVLWMVLKQPVKISQAQYRLFRQLFPLNARPVQPVNGRAVREAN